MPISITLLDWKRELDDGRITALEALHRWTELAIKKSTLDLKQYVQLVTQTLPLVEWHKEGEVLEIRGYIPVTWKSAMDFYVWADNFNGNIFSLGEFLRKYIDENEPGAKEAMVTFKASQTAEIIARREAGESIREIAESTNTPKSTVHDRLSGKERIDTKTRTPEKRKKLQINISQYTTPATAATKIRAVFGDGFANQLKAEL
jgi:hypothetical protein